VELGLSPQKKHRLRAFEMSGIRECLDRREVKKKRGWKSKCRMRIFIILYSSPNIIKALQIKKHEKVGHVAPWRRK
jgi:hypothetical protein